MVVTGGQDERVRVDRKFQFLSNEDPGNLLRSVRPKLIKVHCAFKSVN